MKLNGKRSFKAPAEKVFDAILTPAILQSSIAGCSSVEYLDPGNLHVNLTTPLPGLRGPYSIVIQVVKRERPDRIVLEVHRKGTGGSIDCVCNVAVTNETDGSFLSYSVVGELEGPIAIARNPVGEGLVKGLLNSFFKNLDRALE